MVYPGCQRLKEDEGRGKGILFEALATRVSMVGELFSNFKSFFKAIARIGIIPRHPSELVLDKRDFIVK